MRYKKQNSTYMAQIKLLPIVILIVLIFATIKDCSGQKTKKVDVINLKSIRIDAFIHYDESNVITDTAYFLSGQNAKYTAIVDLVTLKQGTYFDVLDLLRKCSEAFNEEKGTMIDHGHSSIYVADTKSLMLSSKDDNGYVMLNQSQLGKLTASMEAIGKN